jgi:hypothetical protein
MQFNSPFELFGALTTRNMVQGLITESVLVFLRKTMKMLKIDLKILSPFEIFQEKKTFVKKV